ncbi:MAG: hypothetical protein FWC40_08230 [Proteobacteria bacterium]|nr:hypothetical protein [Pseudomonadota bacterium]
MRPSLRFVVFSLLATCAIAATSCQRTVTESGADSVGAYLQFVEQLRACADSQERTDKRTCEPDKVWDAIDAKSKLLFVEAYGSLARIDRIIETYFDPIEHKHMRERTGTNVLKENDIHNARDLFLFIFKPEALVFNDSTNSGLEYRGATSHSPSMVAIHTNSREQDFIMIRESDGIWRNASLRNIFESSLSPIFASENAMKEYAKGNLATEMERRKKVLDYFLIQQAVRAKQAQDYANKAAQ